MWFLCGVPYSTCFQQHAISSIGQSKLPKGVSETVSDCSSCSSLCCGHSLSEVLFGQSENDEKLLSGVWTMRA